MLTAGTELTSAASGRRYSVTKLIGEGGQGAVYEAERTDGGGVVALKWYFTHTATPWQRDAIAELVARGAPGPRFLWPRELVEPRRGPGFGYVMPIRPSHHAGLVELLTGQADVSFSTICRLCIELADSFLALHNEGLCYRDISFGNVFFDPATGEPLICDNDNVGVNGKDPSAVLGTRRFMAPEIVRREAVPSTETDLYSLSVLLFYILMMGHPLVGARELEFQCWDEAAESKLFGRDPVFVFDPDNGSNAPRADLHGAVLQYWSLYPSFVRTLFVDAFTRGLHDPQNGRVRESVWRRELARLRNRIVRCDVCGRESFAEPEGPVACWSCASPITARFWLSVDGGRPLVLSRGTIVHGHHLHHDYDFNTMIGTVVEHPERPGLLGLRNDGDSTWAATLPSGDEREVAPGRSIRLSPDTTIAVAGTRMRVGDRPASPA